MGFLMLIISISSLGSGCATFQFAPDPPPIYETKYTLSDYNNDLSVYKPSGTSVDIRTYYRNKIVFLTKIEIDKNYAAFKKSFFGERAATETLLDIAQIGLTSAGTLAAGETTKAILAAIATGVTGSRLSFNKNFFKEKSPDLLMSRMDALRAEKWSQIHLQLMNSTDNTYSLYEAEGDLFAYYQAGSLQVAFQNIIAESGATQKEAENKIRQQIENKYGGSIGGELASEAERQEVKKLFDNLRALKEPGREEQAKMVIDIFQKTRPEKNPDPKASNFDNVGYLVSLAIRVEYPEVRTALAQAFKEAKSKTKSQ
jgi:hypothetical protein